MREKTRSKTTLLGLYALFGLWFVWSPPFGTTEATVFASLSAYPDEIQISRLILLACFAFSCFAVCVLGRFISPLRKFPHIVWACGVVTSIGMLLSSMPAMGFPLLLMYIGSVLRGVASGCFVLAWIENLAGLDAKGVAIALFSALALYGLAGVLIPLIACWFAAVACVLLVCAPLVSAGACVELFRCAPVRERPAVKPLPLTKRNMGLFCASNLVYGFIFGVMASHFSTLGNTHLYATFGLVALVCLVLFIVSPATLSLSLFFRFGIGAGGLLLFIAVMVSPIFPEAAVYLETGIWVLLIFFTIVIFTDAEFALPGKPGIIAGTALGLAGISMFCATLLFPPGRLDSLSSSLLLAATFVGMLFLALVFLPNGQTWISKWGFSSFVAPESEETFLARRCGEITASYGLTKRELEILELMVQGYKKDDISAELVLSPLTVKTHIRNIYAKLGVHTQEEAISFVRQGVKIKDDSIKE